MRPFDPYRAAKLLLDQFSPAGALNYAEDRIFELADSGDLARADVWLRVAEAIEELRRTEPREGEQRH